MAGPFKMKGSPMARNFGAPFRKENDSAEQVTTAAGPEKGVVKSKAMIRLESNKPAAGSAGYDAWKVAWNKADASNKAGS